MVFAHSGMLDAQVLLATLPLAGVSLLSLLIGMSLQHRIDAETYRRLLKKILFVIAMLLTFQFIRGLWD